MKLILEKYITERPLFLSLIRAKEAVLFQKYLPFKGPVLDVGCGDGFFAKVVLSSKALRHLEGGSPKTPPRWRSNDFDSSDGGGISIDVGLDVLDSRINEAGEQGIYKKLVIYDGLKIPFKDNTFNTVVSNCVLEHIPDLDNTLKEIRRVLKRDGLFITTVMAKPWEDNLFMTKYLGDWYKRWMRKKQVHLNIFNKLEWDKVFTKAGLKIEKSIGYLSPDSCRLIDLCHYISFPNLISYKLTGKWVLFPQLAKYIYPLEKYLKILSQPVKPEISGALFYVLSK